MSWFDLAAVNKGYFLLPLAAAICLVYSASRYEAPVQILRRAGRLFMRGLAFTAGALLVLSVLSRNL